MVKTRDASTQGEVVRTQSGIQALIEGARSEGSGPFRPSAQERDRLVFDPSDYKLEALRATLSFGAWKKWKNEHEIYLDTIGPSWRGVELVLQQARHSGFPLVPSRAGMKEVFIKARDANGGEDPYEPALFEYPAKASTLYKLLVPKLNFDLSTEFCNSAPGQRLRVVAASQLQARSTESGH